MPVSIVVGGQYGSEGKGKVAHYLAREMNASFVVRCGGPNSGHTVIDEEGKARIFQQLPTAAILPDVKLAICAGSYIDLDVLFREINETSVDMGRLFIDPDAVIITKELKEREAESGLIKRIGSTGSGTGTAVAARINREDSLLFAKDIPELKPFRANVSEVLRNALDQQQRILIEGTQGFGLSLLHARHYPYTTSRDTTAAAFLAETGLSPLDVDDVVLTIRAFPIRVAGNSGPLLDEINWNTVTLEGEHTQPIEERTSVTKQVRRVGRFHPEVIRMAIEVNRPTKVVMNHLDYLCAFGAKDREEITGKFISEAERLIKRNIDYVGFGPSCVEIKNRKLRVINKDKNTNSDENVMPGMLSSSHIDYYVQKYGIIENYEKACLGSASYHMRVGENVLTWSEVEKVEFVLGKTEDRNRNIRTSVTLRPNSLTFLTTIEEFKLPKDIIARFNLKSKWVHLGLLLGTGPIVDPQLHARLLIPVHNFSNQPVTMNYGQEFISVEFTKTLDPGSMLPLDNGEFTNYVENPNWNFDFHKYRERIANKEVESSVQSQFQKNNEQIKASTSTIEEMKEKFEATIEAIKKKNEEALERSRKVSLWTLIGAFVALASLAFTTWQLIDSTHEKADAAYNLVKEYRDGGADFRSFALKSTFDDLRKEFMELKRYTERLNTESYQKSDRSVADFKNLKVSLEEKIDSMGISIKELEKRLEQEKATKDRKE